MAGRPEHAAGLRRRPHLVGGMPPRIGGQGHRLSGGGPKKRSLLICPPAIITRATARSMGSLSSSSPVSASVSMMAPRSLASRSVSRR